MKVDGLKPCPFCSGSAEIECGNQSFNIIRCQYCGANLSARSDTHFGYKYPQGKSDLIKIWNTRSKKDTLWELLIGLLTPPCRIAPHEPAPFVLRKDSKNENK